MMARRASSVVAAALALSAGRIESCGSAAEAPAPTIERPPATEGQSGEGWSFNASVYSYLVPEARDYAQPTFTADRGWLHLEARYSYEGLDTGSAWVGRNFAGGRAVTWDFTPMLGGVFGRTDGVAPGYKGSLTWWKLQLYSEGEFVYDVGDSSESYFYTWTELTISPAEWFRFGLVTQRTRAYETDLDIQRGFLVGFQDEHFSLTACVFNPDESKPVVVVSVGVSF